MDIPLSKISTLIKLQQMKPLYIQRSLAAILLIISLGLFESCEKEVKKSETIELLSFGPAGVKHGEDISFIGNNLDKVTAIEMTNITVEKKDFKKQTPEEIIITVPELAGSGKVVLKTPQGDIISKAPINFEVPVVINEVPLTAKPGDNITLKGSYMNWINEIRFERDVVVTEFVSKSLTELVVQVPLAAQTGKLIISTAGTEPLVIETEEVLELTLPTLSNFTPNPVERGTSLTITGTNLDLVEGISFKGVTDPVTTFVSKSATQIVVTVPEKTQKGSITLVPYSKVPVVSATPLELVGDLPALAALKYTMYNDKLENNWQNWGWSSSVTFDSKDLVRDGDASIKVNYTGNWGALKFANASVETAAYTEIVFSIFGTEGTGGKKIHVKANDADGYLLTIEEGKWVDYKLTKAQLGNPATINNLTFQNQDWQGVVYIDFVGLR